MSLSNKYNIPPETVKRMIDEGVLSAKWPTYDEVYDLYKTIKAQFPNLSKSEIYYKISDFKRINYFTVKQIVTRMDKI